MGMWNGTATLEDILAVSYETIYILTLQPGKGVEMYVHIKTIMWMFIETLFIISQTWKQPRCPSLGECINKMWYIQSIEYYSALKWNELPSHGGNLNAYY